MRIEVARGDLLRAMQTINKIVESRSTIPVLSHALIEADGERLTLSGTDLQVEAKVSVPATGGSGRTTANARLLASIAREATSDIIALELGERLIVAAGEARFELPTFSPDDFPKIEAKPTHSFDVDLAALCAPVRHAESTDAAIFYLNGVYLHAVRKDGGDTLRAVATDHHRLTWMETPLPGAAKGMPGVIIPRKTAGLIPSGTVNVGVSEDHIRFSQNETVITSLLVQGSFPEYTRVIPTNNANLASLDRKALIGSVSRVSLLSSDKGRAVKLNIAGGKLVLSVNNPDSGSASEEIAVDYSGRPIEFGLNARYLLDTLNSATSDVIEIAMSDPGAPVLFRSTENWLGVVMPMKV